MVNVKAWSVAKRKAEGFSDIHIKETSHKKADLEKILKANVEKTSITAIKNLIIETNDNATTGNESGNASQSANV